MKKEEIDQLYHLLRVCFNLTIEEKINTETCLLPIEQLHVIYGLCRHLLAGGDYSALVQFSEYYGNSYLLGPVCEAIKETSWKPLRVVDLGAGLGWLGRGLASMLGLLPILSIDKRPWPLVHIVSDLETETGKADVLHAMKDGDLVVACDFIHCLGDPYEVMVDFWRWPLAILEYLPGNSDFAESYSTQIHRYGANPLLSVDELKGVFPGRKMSVANIDPYVLLLIDPSQGL